MARAEEVPDSLLETWYDTYLSEWEAEDDEDQPTSYEDWVSFNWSDLLEQYNNLLDEYAADYALD